MDVQRTKFSPLNIPLLLPISPAPKLLCSPYSLFPIPYSLLPHPSSLIPLPMLNPSPPPLLHHWLTKTLPDRAYALTQYLGRWQMLLLLVCLGMLTRPLLLAHPAIWQQGIVSGLLIALGYSVLNLEDRHAHSSGDRERLHLLMIALSSLVTLRYLYYRTRYTLNLDTALDATFSLLLYGLSYTPWERCFCPTFRPCGCAIANRSICRGYPRANGPRWMCISLPTTKTWRLCAKP
jgi:hypothetical protein